jgi:hypothetical protein
MKSIEMAWSLALLMTVILICCIIYACYRFVETTIASIPCEAFVILGLVCCASLGLVVSGASVFAVRWMSYRSRHIFAKGGLYPHVYDGRTFMNLNEQGAQTMVALSAGGKPPAAVVSKMLDRLDPALISGPAAEQRPSLTVDDVLQFDPKTSPHWLLIGGTGSGKTSSSYQILSQLKRLYSCEFVIAEPRAVNWGNQASATNTADIAALIVATKEEMERRQDMLRQHDVDHITALPAPPPYYVLVAEELDTVFDDLKLADRDLRTAAIVALRAIARMGRKAGVCLVAVSTSGTSDVFDAHVRKNLGNVLLFRSEHTVAESWRIGTKLNGLKPGMAYSVAHSDFVQFDAVHRPQLVQKMSPQTVQCDSPVVPVVPVVTGGCEVVVPRLERGCEPDEQLAEQLRQLVKSGLSKTKLCEQLWGYKDGAKLSILNRILSADEQLVGHYA